MAADKKKPVVVGIGTDAERKVEHNEDGSVTVKDKQSSVTIAPDNSVSIQHSVPVVQVDLQHIFDVESITTVAIAGGSRQEVLFKDGKVTKIVYSLLGEVAHMETIERYSFDPASGTATISRSPPSRAN